MKAEVSSYLPIRREMAFQLTSIGSSLLAIGDGMVTGAVLLSYLVLF